MARVRTQTPSNALRTKSASPGFDDSPSRQLMLDLERALNQAQIHETELQKVHVYDRRLFRENLDRLDTKKAQEDAAALTAATTRHETVRKEAEAELQRYYRELEEQDGLKKQEEERVAKEQHARAKAEAKRKSEEEAKRKARIEKEQAAARKAAEERAQAEEAENRKREETAAREKAEKERKQQVEQEVTIARQQAAEEQIAREQSTREKKAQETASETIADRPEQTTRRPEQQHSTIIDEHETQHQRFLQIHQNLKKFRKDFWAQCKKDANLKSKVGDLRRAIKTSVGQLTEAKGANRQPTERIKSTLKDAVTISSPPIDVRDYFAKPPPELQTAEQSQCPSLLVYVLNIFSKAIISQFGGESGISVKAAEPAGVLVAQMYAATEYQFKGHSLIDILLAKLHFACPVLWGIYADEKTPQGRSRLGWRREGGGFVSESRHYERVSGLGAGFASIALRNFTKSRLQNPFPPTNFWECLANILNIPPGDVQPTHLFVLKAMLENSAERFVQFYGSAAIAALRLALINFPASLPPSLQNTAASKAITLLVDLLAREKNLTMI